MEKKILFILTLFVVLGCSCGLRNNFIGVGDKYLDAPYNIYFAPAKVHRGDMLTITFDLSDDPDGIKELYFKDLTVDTITHTLTYIDGSSSIFQQTSDCSQDVEFGFDVSDDLIERYKGQKVKYFGNIWHTRIYATYFTYIDTSKIICKVPDNAVTGLVYVFGQLLIKGFSEEKLIVIDSSGDPIY